MLGYDTQFASIATTDHVDALRNSYVGGRIPYRSDDGSRERDTAERPVLAPAFGSPRERCDTDLSQRAA